MRSFPIYMMGDIAVRMVDGTPVPMSVRAPAPVPVRLGMPVRATMEPDEHTFSRPKCGLGSAPTVPRDPVNVQKESVNSALGKMLRGEN
jgi:hypothetical protein